jgi:rhodanese-related sulfurtransferase
MKVSRTVATVICIVSFLVACLGTEEQVAPSISPVDLYERSKGGTAPLVLDVRTPEEFQLGHIPGAVNIPHTELTSRIDEVRSEHGVVLHCMIGPRARLGETALLEAGVPNVLHLEGGFAAWRRSGLPVVEPDAD